MRYLICFQALILFLSGCSGHKSEQSFVGKTDKTIVKDSCKNLDSILYEYAVKFQPDNIKLAECMSSEFQTFLDTTTIECIRKQNNYKFFISAVLAKLYAYHINCCKVGFDLLGMKEGAAKIIINEFQSLSGYDSKNLEFLESGNIVSYINNDSELKNNKILAKIIQQVQRQ